MAVKFQIIKTLAPKDEDGEFRWHVAMYAVNQNLMFWSETYTQRHNAVNAIHWLLDLFGYEGDYEVINVNRTDKTRNGLELEREEKQKQREDAQDGTA